MKNILKKSLLFAAFTLIGTGAITPTAQAAFYPKSLNDFKQKRYGVGVLPYYLDTNGEKYILLGREVNSRRQDWKEFSGGAEKKLNKRTYEHPNNAAMREFYEETIMHKTLGWTEQETRKYIDPRNNNTTEVVARYDRTSPRGRRITYFTKFSCKDLNKLMATFGAAYHSKGLAKEFQEKDGLIAVRYTDLVKQVKAGNRTIDLTQVKIGVGSGSNKLMWSASKNKPVGTALRLDSILYNTLRAHHATDQKFNVRGVNYQYVQDTVQNKPKYQFYCSEQVLNHSKL